MRKITREKTHKWFVNRLWEMATNLLFVETWNMRGGCVYFYKRENTAERLIGYDNTRWNTAERLFEYDGTIFSDGERNSQLNLLLIKLDQRSFWCVSRLESDAERMRIFNDTKHEQHNRENNFNFWNESICWRVKWHHENAFGCEEKNTTQRRRSNVLYVQNSNIHFVPSLFGGIRHQIIVYVRAY